MRILKRVLKPIGPITLYDIGLSGVIFCMLAEFGILPWASWPYVLGLPTLAYIARKTKLNSFHCWLIGILGWASWTFASMPAKYGMVIWCWGMYKCIDLARQRKKNMQLMR